MPILFRIFLLFFYLVPLVSTSSFAAVQTVKLPISLDYPLLRTLLIDRAFPEPGEKVTLVNEFDGCIHLTMANPRITGSNSRIQLEVEVRAQAGTPLVGNCFNPIAWSGFLVLEQQPYITKDWKLAFNTVETRLLGDDRQPGRISTVLWELIKPSIHSYLNRQTIDLMPSVTDLKSFLLPLFPHHVQERSAAMIDSMRPGPVTVLPDQVRVDILAEVEEVFDPETAGEQKKLTDEQFQQLVALWENVDSMISFLVTILSQETLSRDEQRILIEVLLDTRYRFTEELASGDLRQDFVRRQFVDAWQQLSPIFHNHLYKKADSSSLLGYLAFVSASDALTVLDRLGPTFGLEISSNGLIRLIQMLHGNPEVLNYQYGVNPSLQQLFQLNLQQNDRQPGEGQQLINQIFDLFSPASVYAAEQQITMADILKWRVPSDNLEDYIDRVNAMLDVAILRAEHNELVPEKLQPVFHQLIEALAWQESCFRQFVTRDGKLTYLLSYNKSSVGILQINERVWRGIYSRERLRWDIRYNAGAGCEIAAMYLTRYALGDPAVANQLKGNELAGLVYAMYNGGPGQYKKYRERLKKKSFYKSDKLFAEKFGYVQVKDEQSLRKCLTGG